MIHSPLLRQNLERQLFLLPLTPTVAIPVASLPGSSWVVSPVFLFFPSLPPCVLFVVVWIVLVCLVLFFNWFCAFILLDRTPWVGGWRGS